MYIFITDEIVISKKIIISCHFLIILLFQVFINVLLGSIFLGNALPSFQYFMNAQASASEIYGTIERVSLFYNLSYKAVMIKPLKISRLN